MPAKTRKPAMTARRADALRSAASLALAEWDGELMSLTHYGELTVRELEPWERNEARELEARITDLKAALDALGRYGTKVVRDAQMA
jgi:hypothetical protein